MASQFLIAIPSLEHATNAIRHDLFPGPLANPYEAREILLEESTLLLNWVMAVPENEPIDPDYFTECKYLRFFYQVFDDLVQRRDWIGLTQHFNIEHMKVCDFAGTVLVFTQGEDSGDSRSAHFQ